jgi:hypothetical protein
MDYGKIRYRTDLILILSITYEYCALQSEVGMIPYATQKHTCNPIYFVVQLILQNKI